MCEHDNITDAGICKSCDVDITSQEFIDSLPEAPEGQAYLGDLMGIIRLAETVAKEYTTGYTKANPRFGWVGTQLMRMPIDSLWEDLLIPSFPIAKSLGYRGDYERWAAICKEYAGSM